MSKALICLLFLALRVVANASLVVWDPGLAAQNAGNEVVNFAKWTSTELHTLNTELNTLHQYENSILQLARLGNPAALQSLPGISSIAQLYGSGQQLLATYQQIRNIVTRTPQNLQSGLASLQSAYSLQRWNPLSPVTYQFPTAAYSVSQTVQDQMAALEKQRQLLEQQRDQALQSLQSATTTSDVQKYHATVSGINGALAEIAARANELAQKAQLQQQQLNAGAAIQRQQVTESSAASFGSDINTSISALDALSVDFGKAPHWPEGK
jgi:hypothetical protein